MSARVVAMLLSTSSLAGCNAMSAPCLSSAPKSDLVGSWSYVGRPPHPTGADASLDDKANPHAESLELRADGTYAQRYGGETLARIREKYPDTPEVRAGQWDVAQYCAGDLFLPSEWLRFYPGPRVRHFELDAERLTIFYPYASGFGHEIYERQPPH